MKKIFRLIYDRGVEVIIASNLEECKTFATDWEDAFIRELDDYEVVGESAKIAMYFE